MYRPFSAHTVPVLLCCHTYNAYTQTHMCSDTVLRSFSSYLPYLPKTVWNYRARQGHEPLHVLPLKSHAFQISTQPTVAKTMKLNQQCHDLPQMLKPPLPHLHLTGMFLISPNGVTGIWKRSLTETQAEVHPRLRNWPITTLTCA